MVSTSHTYLACTQLLLFVFFFWEVHLISIMSYTSPNCLKWLPTFDGQLCHPYHQISVFMLWLQPLSFILLQTVPFLSVNFFFFFSNLRLTFYWRDPARNTCYYCVLWYSSWSDNHSFTYSFLLLLLFVFLQLIEKKIAFRLKWDLNAVTVADFIHELSERLDPILNSYEYTKLVQHSLTLANVYLICKFMNNLECISFSSCVKSLLSCALLALTFSFIYLVYLSRGYRSQFHVHQHSFCIPACLCLFGRSFATPGVSQVLQLRGNAFNTCKNWSSE